jgi:hypothetical protein
MLNTGMGLVGRLRLGHMADVQQLVAPWVDGPKAGPPGRPVSGNLAGYLVFAELAERTGDPRYARLVRDAAGVAFTERGELKESMGSSNGMSDGVFMSIPILGKAFKLTGDQRFCRHAAVNNGDQFGDRLSYAATVEVDEEPAANRRNRPSKSKSTDTILGSLKASSGIGSTVTCATRTPKSMALVNLVSIIWGHGRSQFRAVPGQTSTLFRNTGSRGTELV